MVPARTEALMRAAGLRHERNCDFTITPEIIRMQRELPFVQMWRLAHDRSWFHIQLEDLSIIQFQREPSPSFHFIECPLSVPTLSEFVSDLDLDYRKRHDALVKEMYDQVIETAELRAHLTPIRYDQDYGSYRAGVHPAAHLHIGLDNNVRLALTREMTPLSFLLFVIRQRYPENWERLLGNNSAANLKRAVREGLVAIPENYWCEHDYCEISLS